MVLFVPNVPYEERIPLIPPIPRTVIPPPQSVILPPPIIQQPSRFVPISQHIHHSIPKEKNRSLFSRSFVYFLLVATCCITCCMAICYSILFSTTILPYIISQKQNQYYCTTGDVDKQDKLVTSIKSGNYVPELKVTGVGDVQLYLTRAQMYSDYVIQDTTTSKANHWLTGSTKSSIFGGNSLDISPKYFYYGNATCLSVNRDIILNSKSETALVLTTSGNVRVTRDPDFDPQLRSLEVYAKQVIMGDSTTSSSFEKINAITLQSDYKYPLQVVGKFSSYTLLKLFADSSLISVDLQQSTPSLAISGNNVDIKISNFGATSYSDSNIDIKVSSAKIHKNYITLQFVQQPYYSIPIIILNAGSIQFQGDKTIFQVSSNTGHSARALFVGRSSSSSFGDRHITIDASNVDVSLVYSQQ